ncbi:MAG: ABC transporter permease [Oceanobacter sp.]
MSNRMSARLEMPGLLRLALRLLWREARSGELTLILIALLVAVSSATTIAVFGSRLEQAMTQNASQWLGADVRIESSVPFTEEELDRVVSSDLESAQTLTFPSVVLHNDEMTLAAIKAVGDGYPLRSRLSTITQEQSSPLLQQSGPEPGNAWVESRVLALLGMSLGDTLNLGGESYRVTAEIVEETDRGGGFYSLSPRVMVHLKDLENSPLLGPGARLKYRLLLAGENASRFADDWPARPQHKIQTPEAGNQRLQATLERANQYLSLGSLLAVVLAGVAISISARRYSERHFDISALMRTFGLARNRVLFIYLVQLIALGVLASVMGAFIALLAEQGLVALLAGLLPPDLPSASPVAWLLGMSTGLVCLLGFGIPHLLPLSRVSPLRVLRRELEPLPLAGWVLNGLAVLALAFMLWSFTGDLRLTVWVMAAGVITTLALMAGLSLLIRRCRVWLTGVDLPLAWRFAWQHLSRDTQQTAGQILALSMTLQVMLVVGMLRNDLMNDWQASLPEQSPNVFALNIQPHESSAFRDSLEAAEFSGGHLYPVVPGRLLAINGQSIQELGLADIGSIDRDLALTSDSELPTSNRLVAGSWEDVLNKPGQLSMEVGLAERLGVTLGDQLSFRAAGVDFDAEVSSLREVDWTSMQPNFFMMLSADLMERIPGSFITSFHVPPGAQERLTQLIRQYPSVNILDMQALLGQLQQVLSQVTLAVELILAVVLLAAVLVVVSSMMSSLDLRIREGAVVRALGAPRRLIESAQINEFALLGIIASLMALLAAEAICFGLYHWVLDIPYPGLGWFWLALPPVFALILALLGRWMLRTAVQAPPMQVLQQIH